MSVSHSLLAVEWPDVLELQKNLKASSVIYDAWTETDEPWVREVSVGSRVDVYYFESGRGLFFLSEWLADVVRADPEDAAIRDYWAVFRDLGLWSDAGLRYTGIKSDFVDEWLLAVISPSELARLLGRARGVDIAAATGFFEEALIKHPPGDVLEGVDSAFFGGYLLDLIDGLESVVASGRGLVHYAA